VSRVSLVVFGCEKGSPGVTSAVLACAVTWPGPVMVAECDPAGGDLAYRLRRPGGAPFGREPSLISLAAACRGAPGPAPTRVADHCQVAAGGLAVLRGALSAEQAAGLRPYWASIAVLLSGVAGATVLADVGRLHPDNPAMPVVRAADLVVLLGRASVEGLAHLRDRAEHLIPGLSAGRRPPPVAVVVVAEARRGQRSVEHTRRVLHHAGAPAVVVGWLGIDASGLAAVHAGGRPTRSVLLRTAGAVTGRLIHLLPRSPVGPQSAPPGRSPEQVRR